MLMPRCRLRSSALAALIAAGAFLPLTGPVVADQGRREFEVVARKYAYRVSGSNSAEIRVSQNDLVRIVLSTEDIPHSFDIEDTQGSHYRIMKRADPGKPVAFDFRADTAGRFRFYCSLTIDDGCKNMQGLFIVQPASATRAPVWPPAVARLLHRPAAQRWAGE